MENCRGCKHWEGLPYQEGAEIEWGGCLFVNDGRLNPNSERAGVSDASGYAAWLTIRGDFGCVEFTAREVNP